jgi:hypothetical protein
MVVVSSNWEFNWSWRAAVEERGHVLDNDKELYGIESAVIGLTLYLGIGM